MLWMLCVLRGKKQLLLLCYKELKKILMKEIYNQLKKKKKAIIWPSWLSKPKQSS